MKTLLLNGQEILQLGFPQGKVIGMIIQAVAENYTEQQKEFVINFLRGVIKHPAKFRDHKALGDVAMILLGEARKKGQRAPLQNDGFGERPMVIA